jgi:hypothetical protein
MGRTRARPAWGANLASQPNTARHLVAARRPCESPRRRAAHGSCRAVGRGIPDSSAQRRGAGARFLHVIITERIHDAEFVARHTVGSRRSRSMSAYPPEWAAAATGIAAERIRDLARRYAATKPAMVVLGGSSMHKGLERLARCPRHWLPSRAHGQRRCTRRRFRAATRQCLARAGAEQRPARSRSPAVRPLRPEPDAARHASAHGR